MPDILSDKSDTGYGNWSDKRLSNAEYPVWQIRYWIRYLIGWTA
jgi:hypothetical protein